MTSKAEKRRKRKAFREMAALADVPRREPNGRKQRRTNSKDGVDRTASDVALRARQRMMGADNISDMRDPGLSDDAGKAITLSCDPDTAEQLVGLWRSYMAARDIFTNRSFGMSEHPKCARLEMVSEYFETRADDRPDLRTEEEKLRAAVNAWERYKAAFGELHAVHRRAINTAKLSHITPLVDLGRVTPAGIRFVAAMKVFAEKVK